MAPWKQLQVRQLPYGISLYVRADLAPSGYTIHVTDLIRIWTERLDRRAIMRRAMDENTTIDPTNGLDQFQHLLDHIGKSLAGEGGTHLAISSLGDDSRGSTLRLDLTSTLPAPLSPLRWPVTLELNSDACFSSELVVSALVSLTDLREGMDRLLAVIKKKDQVIQKLQDKLEVTGIGIGAAFPALSSRKGATPSLSAVQHAVPALREFDYAAWTREEAAGLRCDVFTGNDAMPKITSRDAIDPSPWWRNLSPPDDADGEVLVSDSQADMKKDGSSSSIPERRKSSRRRAASASSTSTEDLDLGKDAESSAITSSSQTVQHDLVAESIQQPSIQHPVPDSAAPEGGILAQPSIDSHKAPTKRLGRLGGKKKVEAEFKTMATDSSTLPSTSVHSPFNVNNAHIRSSLASTTTDQHDTAAAQPSSINSTAKAPKLGRIGRLGGGAGRTGVSADASATNDGVQIKRELSPTQDVAAGAEAADSTAAPTRGQRQRETSVERANRRRAELKRSLDESSAKGGKDGRGSGKRGGSVTGTKKKLRKF